MSPVPAAEPSPFTDRAWYSWLVLGVAMTLTTAGTIVLYRAIAHTDDQSFVTLVNGAEERITRRMEIYGAMLRGAAGLFNGLPEVDRATFAAYTSHIDIQANCPGILGLGWCAPVPPGTEADTVRWMAAQGYSQPRLWPDPVPDRERTAVLLLEPDTPDNREVIGFDMASEAIRRDAMAVAREDGDARATGPIITMQDQGQTDTPGFLVFVPIFAHGDPRRFRGFVYAPFRCRDLFDRMFMREPDAPLTLRIRDVDGEDHALYDTTTGAHSRYSTRRRIPLLGRTWEVEYRSTRTFDQRSSRELVPLFAGAGLVLAFGLFLLARSQVRAVAENIALYRTSAVARREAELSLDINRRLASTLDPQSVAQAVTDAGRELTGASFGAFFTTGSQARDLAVYALSGESAPRFSAHGLPRITELFAPTIDGQEVIRLDDVRTDPRYDRHPLRHGVSEGQPAVASYLAVAVRSRTGEVLGGLLYAHPEPGRFSTDHERLLLGLAAQAAIAFDNARLFEAEREARRIAGHRADDLSQANSELQQFIYVSSHDLQEPLRTITQYLDLLERRYTGQLDEQAKRYISYASESASRMYVLLNDLLTYSRLGREAERTLVELAEVVDEVRQDLRVVVTETRARIVTEALPAVRCDRAKIRSLFQNLIGNSLKFRGMDDPRITISASIDDTGMWTVAVADNGIGIRAEYREAVFEVFHRLHDREAFPGTGIGLAICRKVVEQHGGRIWIDETPGGGATFFFTLPEDGSGPVQAIITL